MPQTLFGTQRQRRRRAASAKGSLQSVSVLARQFAVGREWATEAALAGLKALQYHNRAYEMEALMGNYEVRLEISGPTAMWTRPDSGDCPVSYPVPTYSAVKGIFEAILFNQAVEVVPRRVEICAPIVYHTYNTNYGGPLRKSDQTNKGVSYQLVASVLTNPCYRFFADVRRNDRINGGISQKTEHWLAHTTSPPHAYQEIFYRRLKRGQSHYIPCLGWKEFTPDYVGPSRPETQVCSDINMTLPSMLRQVFPDGLNSGVRFIYDQNVRISNGVLEFGEADHAQ